MTTKNRKSGLLKIVSPTISPSTFKAAYNTYRKTDYIKLKFICSNALQKMSAQNLLDLAVDIIKKPPDERLFEEIQILIKATESMFFFQELNKKNSHIRMNTHEKICSRMVHEFHRKGSAIMHFGDSAKRCYIILKGSVNIFVPRDARTLQDEISNSKFLHIPESILKKLVKWRKKLKECIERNPVDENSANLKAFITMQRKATVELNPEIIKQLTMDLAVSPQNSIGESFNEEIEEEAKVKLNQDIIFEEEIIPSYFSENEKETLKKLEEILGGFPLCYLENPEKYFENGVFKFHFTGELKRGQIFGEVGLLMKKTRSATVICKEDCEFAVLNYDDFKKILQNVERRNIENKVDFFKESLFKGIPSDVVIRLSLLFRKKKYFQGNVIYGEGDNANEMYLIKKGEVEILKKVKDKSDGKETSINDYIWKFRKSNENRVQSLKYLTISISKLSNGQYFGEEDLLKNQLRSTTAISVSSKLTVFAISKQNFVKILTENQEIHKNFLTTYRMKSSWMNFQIKNYFNTHSKNKSNQTTKETAKFFPIRREISEIYELNPPPSSSIISINSFIKRPQISTISSLSAKNLSKLKINKIPYIVNRNEKTLEDLNKNYRGNPINPYTSLLEGSNNYQMFSKVISMHKSKYKSYSNADPLNTRVKFDFNEFLKKKMKDFIEIDGKNNDNYNKGWLTERREREIIGLGCTKRLKQRMRLTFSSKYRARTARDEEFSGGNLLKVSNYIGKN